MRPTWIHIIRIRVIRKQIMDTNDKDADNMDTHDTDMDTDKFGYLKSMKQYNQILMNCLYIVHYILFYNISISNPLYN
jgi:hypothetical protein